MLRTVLRTALGIGVALTMSSSPAVAAPVESPDFVEHVLPLLYDRCYSCHCAKTLEPRGDLRLDTAAAIRKSGVVVPGKPDESELLARVSLPHADESLMPPLKGGSQPLNEAERDLLRRWIAAGAEFGTWTAFEHRQPAVEFHASPLTRVDVPQLVRRFDELVEKYHAAKGTKLNEPIDDATFLRRVYLDVAGRIPSLAETTRFLDDPATDKRSRLIDALLDGPGYVSHTFNWKADQLRLVTRGFPGQPGWMYDAWVRDAIRTGMHYDEFVRRLVTAEGYLWSNGAVGFFQRDLGMPLDHMSNLSRLFLGTRIECAQCHDHPFEPVTQRDFYELTAFTFGTSNMYSSAGYSTDHVPQWNALLKLLDERNAPEAVRQNASSVVAPLKRVTLDTEHLLEYPDTYMHDPAARGTTVALQTPFGDEPTATAANRRQAFAAWLTSPRNPRFSRNIANRLFKRVMGLGLIEPVDSLSPVNRPEQPELFEFLAETVARLGFDERAYLAVLLNSRLYQSAAERADPEPGAPFALRGPQLRRLSAEQLWDSLLTLIVEDLDRRPPFPAEQIPAIRARWEELTTLSPEELYDRSVALAAAREDLRRHTLALDERKTALKQAQTDGDAAAVTKLNDEIDALTESANAARDVVRFEGPTPKPETDPRWRGLPTSYVRASELPTPIALGHFLRQFGQSDRREIDAFNTSANITHSLALMNGELTKLAFRDDSYLRRQLPAPADADARMIALYRTLLVRDPTPDEAARCRELSSQSATPEADLIWALINSPEFLFLE